MHTRPHAYHRRAFADDLLSQLSEYEREKERHKKKREGKSVINAKSQAVAATAVGVSWLTAGILSGGLVVAGTMVAAGVTVGSMGGKFVYHGLGALLPAVPTFGFVGTRFFSCVYVM